MRDKEGTGQDRQGVGRNGDEMQQDSEGIGREQGRIGGE